MKFPLSLLSLSLFAVSASANETAVTFNEHIAPLIHQNCSSCHRKGESAPFQLISFNEVSKKATTISRVIGDSYMPPWHASTEHFKFVDVRKLTSEEITLFTNWVEQGKAEGDPEKAPSLPEFTEGWQLGEPDLVVTMENAFEVPADGPDIYRNFVLPLDLPEDKWVKAIELRPSARAVVHHSLYFLDDSGTARSLDGKDGRPGFNGMGFRKSGSLGGYVPGVSSRMLPGDLARPLPKGSDFVLSTHFHPTGKTEKEQTTVGFFFTDKAPSRNLKEIQVPPGFGRAAGIDIPAGESDYKVEDTFKVPVDIELVSINGHAHYTCSSMKMTALLPDSSEQVLLDIPEWDLDWQDSYFFKDKIILPAGTVLKSDIRYDNSAENPDNPFSPPQRIKWGRESTDEMGSITLSVVPAENSDERRLTIATAVEKAKLFANVAKELQRTRVLDRLPQIVKALDKDGDGNLHSSELPRRMRSILIERLDADKDDSLNPSEIQVLRDWLQTLRNRESSPSQTG